LLLLPFVQRLSLHKQHPDAARFLFECQAHLPGEIVKGRLLIDVALLANFAVPSNAPAPNDALLRRVSDLIVNGAANELRRASPMMLPAFLTR
jgi:hypothetical protein